MAYQSPFAPAPEKQATGGYVSPFQKSKPAKAAPAPAPVSSPVVPKPSSTVSLRATGPRKNLVPKAVTTLPDQGQTLSAPTTPLPKVPIKEAIVQSGKDALAVKPVQREKSGQSLIEQTYLSTVSQGANALKFAVEKVAKEPTVLLGPLHYVPGVSKLNEPARKKVDQLNAEGKNPFASVASEAELRRASFTTDSPEYQKASLTEKITKYLPETLYNLVPDVAGSAVPYLINPSLGFAVAAGSTAEDVKQKAVENGVPEKEAEAIGITTGLAVGALDRIVPDEIFGGSAATKTLFSKGFFTRLAQMTKTGLKEAATEVAQEDIQLAAEATFRDDLGWDEIKTRNVMAGLGGLFGGAGMKAVGEIAMQTPDVMYGQEAQAAESTPPEGTPPPPPPPPTPSPVSSEAKTSQYDGTYYRFESDGAKSGKVRFFSKNKEYASEYATVRKEGGKTGKIIEEKITTKNPLVVEATDTQFSDPSFEKIYIDQAIKNGNDSVVFKNGDDVFVAKIEVNGTPAVQPAAEPAAPPSVQPEATGRYKPLFAKPTEAAPETVASTPTPQAVSPEQKPAAPTPPVQVQPSAPPAQPSVEARQEVEAPATPVNPETFSDVDALSKYAQESARKGSPNDSERAGRQAKGVAMEFAAIKRKIEGNPTDIEFKNGEKYLTSNYFGKKVTVDGQSGIVQRPSFGRIGVKLQNGETKYFAADKIQAPATTREAVIEYLRSEAQKQFDGKKQLYSNFFNTPARPKIPPQRVAPAAVTPADAQVAAERGGPVAPAPAAPRKITPQDTPLYSRVLGELTFAQKGERIMRADSTFTGVKSTFPAWVPSGLRSRKLFDAVLEHINNGTIPTKTLEARLYETVRMELDSQNEVLNDEKYIASLREDVIVPFATDEENSLALAKFDEQYGKLKASQDGSPTPGGGTDERVGAAIQAETKPTEVAAEKAKPVRSTKAESRVLERLRQGLPELGEGVEYTVQSLKENTAKAVQLVEDDKTKAYRIAMGVESAPENQTQTAVSIALAEKALEDGNLELYGQLTRQRTLEQTRRGQEIVAEKGSVTDNSTSRYVKELVRQRLAKYDAGYLGALKAKMLRKAKGSKAIATIDEEVGKIKERIKNTKELDLDEAQKFLDSLACK